ncbi:hypothetical protein CC86DRAFT_421855 [Ophiobolus disseminans]|uniref:peptidylprolyl isomerase n=1 Tax=Ophiobolus disseminans TaxID=1469910 RepID=A0A6A6ZTZ2_9PLEO|nr:hypothetical protein CC86DRAFT_421855 [Ophiobolus disseminans]
MSGKARYTVKFVAGEQRGSLLVLLSPSQLCSALVDAVKKRVPDLNARVGNINATLHLEEPDGPELDLEDVLSDILPGAKETVVVIFQIQKVVQSTSKPTGSTAVSIASLKIHVISSELARSCDIDAIRPLRDVILCTLKELKSRVQIHLGFPADDGTCPELECNCKIARQIDENAALNERGAGDYEASRTVILVHGHNNVVAIPLVELTRSALQETATKYLAQPNKVLTIIGGVKEATQMPGSTRYLKAPVLAICSQDRHTPRRTHGVGNMRAPSQGRDLIVDIHTLECPIELTAHNAGVTLANAGLEECAIDGVLNIFAVQRWMNVQTEIAQGKAGIFKRSDAWEHPNGQSDRGISNLLSTLRVFVGLTSGGNMEEAQQDAVLHMIHLLTRFPPAVRAAYILMRGETPRSPERAALAQCVYEVLKTVVPLRIVGSNCMRLFEGSRLLFGLILEKAKNMKLSSINDHTHLPYVGMSVYDLQNTITIEPVLSTPVQTKSGLLDLGLYKAFQEAGILSRAAILSGGAKTRIIAFDFDAVNTNTRYADRGNVNTVVSPAEYSELSYLAGLCARNQLSVIPPSALPSATPPVLTLDREGSLSVYIGRADCAEAGRDILLFRPTSAKEEEGVDVSIITQLLEPILARRTADGTVLFEAYGDQHRKLVDPDEIAVICIDLSQSMTERCRNTSSNGSGTVMAENPAYHLPDSDELKEYPRTHESFDDCLAIIRTGRDDYEKRLNAEKVLQILQQFHMLKIEAKAKELEKLRRRSSHYHYRTRADDIEREMDTIKNRYMGLQKYTTLICAWLLTCLGDDGHPPDPLLWNPGDTMPDIPRASNQGGPTGPMLEIPRDLCCHISSEIMSDPVTTVDGFTYERKNIERWFQTNEKSPLTNLVLSSLDLRPNVAKKEEVAMFLNGSDIISKYKSLRGNTHLMRVVLKSPINTWSLMLPRNLTLYELQEMAFRLTKWRHSDFELQHRNVRLPSTTAALGSLLNQDHTVFVTPLGGKATSIGSHGAEELCLVKVFDKTFDQIVVSFWEPKNSTRSVGSTVFRYYRAKFTANPTTAVEDSLVLWTQLRDVGDGQLNGTVIEGPWERLSQYLNATCATGTLTDESCVDKMDETTRVSNSTGSARTLVLKVALGRPPTNSRRERNQLSRLDVLKQMFDAFINRLLAYNFKTHVGLITFGTKASVSQGITNAVENFRHKLNSMAPSGDTAIWDSIALAQDQLQDYTEQYPNAKLRIICISDGEDNKSQQDLVNVASRLWRHGIVLDCFCLGNASNEDLQTMSYLTNGYNFEPKTLEEAIAICELEPVLSILERPESSESEPESESEMDSVDEDEHCFRDAFRMNPSLYNFRMATDEITVEHVSRDVFPERKELPQLAEAFVELGTFAKHASRTRTDGNLRLSRIHTEIRISGAHPHPDYDIYIWEPNMGLWKVVMQDQFGRPPESTYTGGTFLLYIEMGDDYPMFAPTARFITPIYHPNINRHGRICHSVLDRNWTVDTSNKDLVDIIYSLLLVPEFSDPIKTVVTLNYHWDEVQFKEEAQKHIQKHASKTRAEWREDIVE